MREFDYQEPQTPAEFDQRASQFLDYLWQDDYPEGWAADFVSGVKRYVPQVRRHLPVTTFFFANWRRSVTRQRALPLTGLGVRAFAGLALYRGRTRLAAILLTAFAGCLRFDELIKLTFADIRFSPDRAKAVIILRGTKSGKRLNKVEQVIIESPFVVAALLWASENVTQGSRVYDRSAQAFREELRELGIALLVPTTHLTPYSLRRGGATWHFQRHGSMSMTAVHGRWANEATARIYVDGAAAQLGEWSTPRGNGPLLEAAAAVAYAALRERQGAGS